MTESALYVVNTIEHGRLKWALRFAKRHPELAAITLAPNASQSQLRSMSDGLRDLSAMPSEKLPENLR